MFTTTFGPGGFRTTRMGGFGGQPRQQANAEPRSVLLQLLPLIVLFGFSLLSALPSLFSTPPIPDPAYSWSSSSRYNVERHTAAHDVKYHINAREFMEHPAIGPELIRQGIDLRKSNAMPENAKLGPALAKFEATVERYYSHDVYTQCQRGPGPKRTRQRGRDWGIWNWNRLGKGKTD